MAVNFYLKLVTLIVAMKMTVAIETTANPVAENVELNIIWSNNQKRSINDAELSFQIQGRTVNLNLNQVPGVIGPTTPYYLFKSGIGPATFIKDYISAADLYDIYEDESHSASFSVATGQNGEKYIECGIIGKENLYIERIVNLANNNMPEPRTNRYNVQRLSVSGVFQSPLFSSILSVLPKNNMPPQRISNILYPEILLVIDDGYYSNLKKNFRELFLYLQLFWNDVDFKYRSIKNPSIKPSISGIVIANDPDALSFLKLSTNDMIPHKLNFRSAVEKLQKWLSSNGNIIPVDSYDVAIIHSSKSAPISNVLGLAQGSSVCVRNSTSVLSTAVIFDDAKFGGTVAAAQELAQTLGVSSDGGTCGDNYIMTTRIETSINAYEWSRCSLNDFQEVAKSGLQCLENIPGQYQTSGEPEGKGVFTKDVESAELGDFSKMIPNTNKRYVDLDFNTPDSYTTFDKQLIHVFDPKDVNFLNKVIVHWIYQNRSYVFLVDRKPDDKAYLPEPQNLQFGDFRSRSDSGTSRQNPFGSVPAQPLDSDRGSSSGNINQLPGGNRTPPPNNFGNEYNRNRQIFGPDLSQTTPIYNTGRRTSNGKTFGPSNPPPNDANDNRFK